ncbi:MAG: 50S ribosomal protein L18e [Candidatus Hydrothermarchaeota archaeon]
MARVIRTTNPLLKDTIIKLEKISKENSVNIWRDLAERLKKPRRMRAEVNLSKINRYSKPNDTVAVPGKVLGSGSISHPVSVGAFGFSKSAIEKIKDSGGECLSLVELAKKNPKGTGVIIME